MSRLFVSDLDGTLLDGSGQLSARTRAELVELLASGMRFTVATARSVHTMAPILGDLAISLPVIEYNGAFISDLRTRRSLVCHALEPEIAEVVMRWGLAAGIYPFVSTFTDDEQRVYPPPIVSNAGVAWWLEDRARLGDARLRPPMNCFATLDQAITCVSLIGRAATLAPIAAQIEDSFPGRTHASYYENRYSPGWHWLTVQSRYATKDRALREVAELCGIGLDAVTVFGDDINDVTMFRCAGRAVAVENAIDDLKRIAHEVIGPHHDDSVVQYLRRTF